MYHTTDALNAIKGIESEKLPYAPRFDLWFNAHQYRGTLPAEFRECATALDVARKIGVGGQLVIPDYIRFENLSQMFNRGIGLYHLDQVPYRVKMNRVERRVTHTVDVTEVVYSTPKGSVTVKYAFSEDMRRAGTTISRITQHAINSDEDFAPLIFLFEHCEVEPYYGGLKRMLKDAGNDALVVANASMSASPMQFIMRDLMDITAFYYAMVDNPDLMKALAGAIGSVFEQFMPVSVMCPCDVIMFGANTDETITYPPFYEEYILPWVSKFSALAHEQGKYILLHADGENQSLFDLYRQSGIDILEAVAPSPMTKSDITEILEKTEGMTVWGGIPSVILMGDTFSENAFETFIRTTLDTIGKRTHFILGVSDTTPPDADFGRLLKIKEMAR